MARARVGWPGTANEGLQLQLASEWDMEPLYVVEPNVVLPLVQPESLLEATKLMNTPPMDKSQIDTSSGWCQLKRCVRA